MQHNHYEDQELEINMESSSKRSNHEGRDIISNLPDNIIGHILSSLPTKEAVRTCVLSDKWKHNWAFITRLEFEDHSEIKKSLFTSFVYGVLLHQNTLSIESFSLYLSEIYDPYHVNQLIAAVLNAGEVLKEIAINSRKTPNISSHSFWKPKSLEKLTLAMKNGYTIRFPSIVCFPSLTVLELAKITFARDPSSSYSKNLTLNFPVLRKYKAFDCTWSNLKGVTFEVPLLEVLLIRCTSDETMPHDHSRPIIKFCAPCLTHFYYTGYGLPDTILLDIDLSTTCIAFADIDLLEFRGESEQRTGLLACELMKNFNNNVKMLNLERPQALALANAIPMFGMLTHLELGEVTGKVLLKLLKKTPCLKTLVLKGLLDFDEEIWNPDDVPSCFMANLQVLDVANFTGEEHELCFAKFVMENAQVLMRACFVTSRKLCELEFNHIKELIFSFQTGFLFIEFSPIYPCDIHILNFLDI